MKIRNKLLVGMLPLVCIVFVSLVYITYKTTHDALEREIHARSTSLLDYYVAELDSKLKDMETLAQGLKVSLESMNVVTEDDVKKLIQNFLNTKEDAYGSTVSFQPSSLDAGKDLVGPYYHRVGDKLVYTDLAQPSYNYPKWDWYKIPIETGKPLWSEPYIDLGGGNITMITYSLPFYKDDKPWGVATVDIALSKFTKIIDDIGLNKNGYAFLLRKSGVLLSLRSEGWKLKTTIFEIAKEYHSEELEKLGNKMIIGGTGFTYLKNPLDYEPSWIAFGPIPSTGWSLAIVLPEKKLMSGLTTLNHRIILISVIGLLVIFIAIFKVSTMITNPIANITNYAKRIASGDFAAKLKEIKSNDEVGVLSHTFIKLKDSISTSMERLVEEKEIFRLVFSQMSDGIVITGPSWKVLQHNDAAAKFFSLPIKISLLDYLDSNFESSIPLVALMNPENQKSLFKLSRKEASKKLPNNFECNVAPIIGENRQVKAFVFNMRRV